MSHVLNMYVKNISGYSIKSVNAVHTWDGNTNILAATNIPNNGFSAPQSITSGYTQYDWYTVNVTFGDPNNTQKMMDFYCNSSYSQNTVVLEITMSHLNCRYYANGLPPPEGTGTYDTGCLDKGWT
jgi:hypothetical protein